MSLKLVAVFLLTLNLGVNAKTPDPDQQCRDEISQIITAIRTGQSNSTRIEKMAQYSGKGIDDLGNYDGC
jgi:hypothetical protein